MKKIAILIIVVLAFMMVPMASLAATNGNFTVTVKGYYNNKLTTLTTAYVPYGQNTLTMAYRWDAANYRFVLEATEGASYVTINNTVKYVNNRNMNNTSFTYTSPRTGNGTATKYLYGNSIMSSAKKVTVNIGTIGSVEYNLTATTYGEYTVSASAMQSAIASFLTSKGYDSATFDYTQTAKTGFAYNGCSAVNFKFNGTQSTPVPTATPAATTAAPTATPAPTGDCTLKVWASELGSTTTSPRYKTPYTTKIFSGTSYKWLSPEQYGISAAEGYQFDYYYDNANRQVGSSSYITSHASGWSATAYFKQIVLTNKAVAIQFICEGEIVGTSNITISGKYWDTITFNAADYFGTLSNDYVLGAITTQTLSKGQAGTVAFVVTEKAPRYPVYKVVGSTVSVDQNADVIGRLFIVEGEYNTITEFMGAANRVDITGINSYTATNLYETTKYTIYAMTFDDGYVLTTVSLEPIIPTVVASNGIDIHVQVDNPELIAIAHVAPGHHETYQSMKDTNAIEEITYTLSFSAKYIDTTTEYSVRIVTLEGKTIWKYFNLTPTMAEFRAEGTRLTANVAANDLGVTLSSVRVIRGSFDTVQAFEDKWAVKTDADDYKTKTGADPFSYDVSTVGLIDGQVYTACIVTSDGGIHVYQAIIDLP